MALNIKLQVKNTNILQFSTKISEFYFYMLISIA